MKKITTQSLFLTLLQKTLVLFWIYFFCFLSLNSHALTTTYIKFDNYQNQINPLPISERNGNFPNQLIIDKSVSDAQMIRQLFWETQHGGVHIFTHGAPGKIFYNNKWYSGSNLVTLFQTFDIPKNSLVNIYACQFGFGKEGKQAIEALEEKLSINIAASDDITGIDGDWDLEIGDSRLALVGLNYSYNLQCDPNIDICAICNTIDGTDPSDPICSEDCDGGGIDNATECDAGNDPLDSSDDTSISDKDGDGIPDAVDQDADNDGILDCDEYYSAECTNLVYGPELVINGDFSQGYAFWTSDFNRGKNNIAGPPDTRGDCRSQGWIAISPCSSDNGVCNAYYDYFGGTIDGSQLITDAAQTGANIWNDVCDNSGSGGGNGSCNAEPFPDNTQNGDNLSVYIDPNDIAGEAYWQQEVSGVVACRTYEFSAWLNIVENSPELDFRIAGTVVSSVSPRGMVGGDSGPDVWQKVSTKYTATTSGSVLLELVNTVAGCGGNDIKLDDVSFREVQCDTDGDGVVDIFDLDSDNDGILDAIEACGNTGLTLEDCMLDNDGNATYEMDPVTGVSTGVVMGAAACDPSPADTDGDGIPDYLDLDSDGDGCPDAVEAGTDALGTSNTTDTYVPGTVDDCGLLTTGISGTCPVPANTDWIDDGEDIACNPCKDAIENNLDICAIIAADPTHPLATADCDGGCIDNATECSLGFDPLNPCDDPIGPDKDGDGIYDALDLDDDNDGIPDTVECSSSTVLTFDALGNMDNTGIADFATITNQSGDVSTASFSISPATPYNVISGNRIVLSESDQGDYTVTFTFDVPVVDPQITLISLQEDHQVGNFQMELADGTILNNTDFKASTPAVPGDGADLSHLNCFTTSGAFESLLLTDDSGGMHYTTGGNGDDLAAGESDGQASGTITFIGLDDATNGVVSISFDNIALEPDVTNDNYVIGLKATLPCDTDGDGYPDVIDLDSDNDGIPDAIEACGDITLTLEDCSLDSNGDAAYEINPDTGCSTGVVMGAAPCSPTPADTDGDGTPDYLDLDSDGDGCPDALEAETGGIGTSNTIDTYVAGTVDDCGLLTTGISGTCPVPANTDWIDDGEDIACNPCKDVIENNLDICAIIAADPTHPLATADCDGGCIDNATECSLGFDPLNPCDDPIGPDKDGDGIYDALDLDDDNDGIPDTVECSSSTVLTFDALGNMDNTGIADFATITNQSGDVSTASFSISPATPYNVISGNRIVLSESDQGDYTVTFTFDVPVVDPQITLISLQEDHQVGNFQMELADGTILNNTDFKASTPAVPGDGADLSHLNCFTTSGAFESLLLTDDPGGMHYTTGGNGDDLAAGESDGQASGTITFIGLDDATNGVVSISFDNIALEPDVTNDNYVIGLKATLPCDTDGDGYPDVIDLDSDNDGIPDAIEACGDITLTLEDCSLDSNGDAAYEINPDTGCSTGVVMGAAPCSPTPADTDGDGTPDYLDLDSDGDGCPDALEAETGGIGTSNTIDTYVAGTVDDCGLLTTGISGTCPVPANTDWIDDGEDIACNPCKDAIENNLDICAIIAADPTHPLATADCDGGCIDNATECSLGFDPLNPCDDPIGPDKDGDGIYDALDLDDDNDGIPDTVECSSSTVLTFDALGNMDNTGIADFATITNQSGDVSTASFSISPATPYNVISGNRIVLSESDQGDYTVTFTFDVPVVDPQITLISLQEDHQVGNFQMELADGTILNNTDFKASTPAVPGDGADLSHLNCFTTSGAFESLLLTDDPGGMHYTTGGNGDDLASGESDGQASGTITFIGLDDATNGVVSISFDNIALEPDVTNDNYVIGLKATLPCDTDGDGYPDVIDLDSDNDGIPDAIEACGDITLTLEDCSLDSNGDAAYEIDPDTGCSTGVVMGAAPCNPTPADTDGDGTPDYLDLDSDGDGCPDAVEAGRDALGTSSTIDTYVAGTVDDCGLLTTGISGTCPVPANTDWIAPSDSPACDCEWAEDNMIDICQHLIDFPDATLGDLDCDDGGADNTIECQTGGDPLNPSDDCDVFANDGPALCALLAADPTNPLGALDCDGGGVDNLTECFGPGGGTVDPATGLLVPDSGYMPVDPSDPSDDCDAFANDGPALCALLAADPTNPLGALDCDGGGISNIIECQSGEDPSDPSDDCQAAIDEGVDICALINNDPTHPLANADCDGGGIDNITECYTGENPADPSDDCQSAIEDGMDICAYVLANPTSPLALADCDQGGVSNIDECNTGENPIDPMDDCQSAMDSGMDICAFVLANPTSALALADCDGGGINNLTECQTGEDPFDPSDDCTSAMESGTDICAYVLENPTSPLALADCDGGGINNLTECETGEDPLDPSDDCQSAIDDGMDLCAFVLANPTHPLALADCDGGGINNLTECETGEDPLNPSDDCQSAIDDGMDLCAFILANPTSPLALADCDGGGINNLTECETGEDPLDPSDDCQSAIDDGMDICAFILENPTSPLALADCDGGGINNLTECETGENPFDPTDDCQSALDDGMDICAYILANPTSSLALADCDGGGINNLTECETGEDPFDPTDDCQSALDDGMDICAHILANPTSPLALADCDGGGINNLTECETGEDPFDPTDDCQSALDDGMDICAYVLANPTSPLALADCDGGGINNLTECETGEDPFDPSDDCQSALEDGMDICAYILANPTSPLALADCDGGGINNLTECETGENPFDPTDDCMSAIDANVDVCTLIGGDASHPLANVDCDLGGINNIEECNSGENPLDPTDDCTTALNEGIDICALIAADPNHPLAHSDCDMGGVPNDIECGSGGDPTDPQDDVDPCEESFATGADLCAAIATNPVLGLADCDGGGVDNATECEQGTDPNDPSDDCTAAMAAGIDICAYILNNPTSDLALADCDGGGINNLTECQTGEDPFDPSDDCQSAIDDGQDLCALVLADPTSPLATADCDGGGIDNLTECETGEDPTDPSDDCQSALEDGMDICAYILANPTSPLALADCDGGGINNLTECQTGEDPFDPSDDCTSAIEDGMDICAYILANPTSPLANADCDGGGINNLTECQTGEDPFDPSDDCTSAIEDGMDICAYVLANPTSPLALADCDGGGIDNLTECQTGEDPLDPSDDCQSAMESGMDICAYVLANPTSPLALADCDGGGINNLTECQTGEDPLDPSDDCQSAMDDGMDICAYVLANPTSPLALADCDGGGINNLTECQTGEDPLDPSDDCQSAMDNGMDICAYVLANPTSPLALADCDGGGINNLTECQTGEDPLDPSDDCQSAIDDGMDICAYVLANPTSPLALADCDGGGINNLTECQTGEDPLDPSDDCQSAIDDGMDICAYVLANPYSPLATADCDGGGINNLTECQTGEDPLDPSDDCQSAMESGMDICAYVLANPTSPLALADCDGGGIDNLTECQTGEDPFDPSDDCMSAIDASVDLCAIIAGDATHPLASADCDLGGVDNLTECNSGENPTDPSDDCTTAIDEGIDICALIDADPTHPFAYSDCDMGGVANNIECEDGTDPAAPADDSNPCDMTFATGADLCAAIATDPALGLADCDGGGVDNATECMQGTDPNDPSDDCTAAMSAGIDICTYILNNPTSPLATADCDGGGIDNLTECLAGEDPFDPSDDCQAAIDQGVDICALIGGDPLHPLAHADCDMGGIDNLTECNTGENPLDPSDDCQSAIEDGMDICAYVLANPTSPLATADCDGGGIDNLTECETGEDPTDPADDCTSALEDGMDICAYVLANPTSPLALADCDGGGINNLTECQTGENPLDPSDDCTSALEDGMDICAYVLANPTSPLALADCDGGGIDNLTECETGENPFDPSDDCQSAIEDGMDLCAYVLANPTSPLATADCDGGGIDNLTECETGEDPLDPSDDCQSALDNGMDICAYVLANPTSPLAYSDCDGGGINNLTECETGEDPLDPSDDCTSAIEDGMDLCAYILANPTSPLALADCDGGGINNYTECTTGEDPFDPSDDCTSAIEDGMDLCAFVLANPTSPLALADCDGGGIDNVTECTTGEDPLNPSDDCQSAIEDGMDICAYVLANPTSPLALADCDGGGIDNVTECTTGENPIDPSDDCTSAIEDGMDLCAFVLANPTSPLAFADCDGGGIDNLTECQTGENPLDPSDDCQSAIEDGMDICAYIALNPTSPLAGADCDEGGIDNLTECENGQDPLDPMDDCQSALESGMDICAYVLANPTSALALADCDGGGVNNLTECQTGEDPFDPYDDCASALESGTDICAFVLANPTSPLAQADCDGGGIDNLTECQTGENPLDPTDDCQSAIEGGVDLCALLAANPTSPLAALDCDNGGIDNLTECFGPDGGTTDPATGLLVPDTGYIPADPSNPSDDIFDLALTKQLAPTQQFPVLPGRDVTYQMIVYNQGASDAFDITIVDYIPVGLSFNPAANTAASAGNTNSWNLVNGVPTYVINTLAIMDSAVINIILSVDANFTGSNIINSGEITYGARSAGGSNASDIDSNTNSGFGNGVNEDDYDSTSISVFTPEDVVIIGDTAITTLDSVVTDTITDVDPEATPVFEEVIEEEVDCSKYPVYCYHGLAIELMPMGMVETWASDLSINDYSGCPDYKLGIWHESMSMKQPTTLEEVKALPTNLVFTCQTLGNQEVQLYVTDPEGNWNFCETYINVQDNNEGCVESQTTDETIALLGGQVNTWKGDAVQEVILSTSQEDYMTSQDGFYHFELAMEEDYTVTPQKNTIPLNGVSTFDLVLMTKHILGVQPFDNPYQWIAADVNQSKTITAFDLVQLRKLILAIDTEFTNNTSWRFVEANHDFNSNNPLLEDFPEQVHVNTLSHNIVMDFVAVKIGDINGNVRPNTLLQAESRNNNKVFEIQVADQFLKAGQTYEIDLHAKDISNVQGYQFTINTKDVMIDQIHSELMNTENFGLHNLDAGSLTVSWNQQPDDLVSEEKLFTIQLHVNKNTRLSDVLQLNNQPTIAEAYDLEDNIMEVQLKFTNYDNATAFSLEQNQPNPFKNQTSVAYTLPSNSPVELILRDEAGRVIKVVKQDGKAGYNLIPLNDLELTLGFIHYQLITKFGTKSKKMIRVE